MRRRTCGAGAVAVWLLGWTATAQGGGPSTGLVPINDLGPGLYQGFEGGLYPGGVNDPPPAHAAAALDAAQQIVPRDAAGNPSASGKLVLIAIGMSNTTQEFAAFERQEDLNAGRNARLVILNTALGGQSAEVIRDPSASYWQVVQERLVAMSLTADQVQVAWLKEANAQPADNFPVHAQELADDLRAIVQNLHDMFPNVRLCYLSSRTYGGYAQTTLNPEPMAYESGFSVKWVIADQIDGDPGLNFDPALGPVEAPLLLWGPYLWADGVVPRSDGLTWLAEDFESDGTHPSPSGEQKVADLLSAFFADEPSAAPWFAPQPDTVLLAVDADADASVRAWAPETNFGSEPQLVTVGGSSPANTYLRFDVSAVNRPVACAKLSLRVAGLGAGAVSLVTDSSWNETTITFNNAPPIDGGTLAAVPLSSRQSTVAADVSAAVNADPDGVVTFALTSSQTQQMSYTSREAAQPPRLILVTGTGPSLPGDFDGDGDVDLDDFGAFAACYNGANNPPGAGCPEIVDADLDGDGDVDLDDFSIFAANYTGSR